MTELRAQRALIVLGDCIDEIPNVKVWAEKAGISTRWLYKLMIEECGCSPKKVLRRVRYKTIRACIENDPDMTGYGVAVESGLKDEQSLYKFLSTHYDTGLKDLRYEIWSEKLKDKIDTELTGTDSR